MKAVHNLEVPCTAVRRYTGKSKVSNLRSVCIYCASPTIKVLVMMLANTLANVERQDWRDHRYCATEICRYPPH